ncbi:MAG: hypothetical protein ABI333_08720 [bacterium]
MSTTGSSERWSLSLSLSRTRSHPLRLVVACALLCWVQAGCSNPKLESDWYGCSEAEGLGCPAGMICLTVPGGSGEQRCYAEDPTIDAAVPDAEVQQDAAVLDAEVQQDAAVPDAEVQQDAAVPDAEVQQDAAGPDAEVQQDAAVPDAEVLQDAAVPDAEVVCGDGVIDIGEVCDGAALGGETCQSQGYYGGTLGCNAGCSALVTTGCSGTCGDGTVNGPEVCDGAALGGETCMTQGFYGGTLTCLANCAGFNTGACTSACGNNVVDSGEDCDGANLGGASCGTLGCRSGALTCNTNCTFNPSGCYANHDEDGDGIDDNCDNCPTYSNAGQQNADSDGVGSVCEDPGNAALLSQITAFESLLTTAGIWTVYGGTWTPGVDEVTGSRIGGGGNYLHATSIPNVNYSVEATFHMDQPPPSGANWTNVVFGWSTPGGNVWAYACVYERGPDVLSIYRAEGGPWNWLNNTNITTTVMDSQWHRLRVFRDGDTVRCVYDDQAGGSGQVQISGGDVWADMSGLAGLRVYNETTTFTSFVIYE